MRSFALGLKNPRFILAAILLLALRIFPNAGLSQTTYYWYGDAPDGNWKRGANGARWTGGLWDEPTSGNILMFDNNGWLSMNNNITGYSVHQLLFGANNTQARTIGGNNLSFNDWSGADPKIENQSTGSHTVSLNITGDSNDPLQLNPVSGDLTVSGTINNNGSWIEVYGDNSKMLTLSGVVSGGGGLAIKQYSKVKLAANHTYTGGTVIEEGELWFDPNSNLSGSVTVGSSSLQANVTKLFISDSDGGTTVTNAVVITNGNTATRFLGGLNTSGENTFSGTVTLGAETRLETASGGTVNLSGVVSGGSGLVKIGAGTAKLSGANTFSGGVQLNDGTILVGHNSALGTGTLQFDYAGNVGTRALASADGNARTINNSFNLYFNALTLGQTSGGTGSLTLGGSEKTFNIGDDGRTENRVIIVNGNHTISAAVLGGANNHIVKQGSGILSLTGANTFTGGIFIDQGTIDLGGGSLVSGVIDIGGGVNNTAINSQNATLKVSSASSFGRNITVNSNSGASGTAAGDRTIEFANTTGTATLSGTVALEKTAEVSVASGGAGELTGAVTGAGGISKSGSGRLTLNNANNTYSGGTTLSAGQLRLGHQAAAGTGTITQSDGTSTLEIDTTGTVTNAMNIYNVSTLKTVTLTGAKTLNNATYDVAADTTTTESGLLSGNGGVTKKGAGELILGNTANSFTNIVDIQNGTLSASSIANSNSTSTIGQGPEVKIGSASTAGTFKYTGGTAGMNRTVTVGAAGGTINVNDSAATMTLNGTVTGSGVTLTKTGAGKLALGSGSSATVGTIAIQHGTLLLGAADRIEDTTVITMSGGNLDTAGYADQVGQLKFSGSNVSSTIIGLSSSSNGFLFSGLDTASIGSLADGGLIFRPSEGNIYSTANGLSIKLSSADWVAAAGGSTTLNGFNSKISFADGTLASQISFSGGQSGTYLNVAAIPEPRVYVAAGALALLIGLAEFRRRKKILSSKA